MPSPKKFTKTELAGQFVKEIPGFFRGRTPGAGENAGKIIKGRSQAPEGTPDVNAYKSRQTTDDQNP